MDYPRQSVNPFIGPVLPGCSPILAVFPVLIVHPNFRFETTIHAGIEYDVVPRRVLDQYVLAGAPRTSSLLLCTSHAGNPPWTYIMSVIYGVLISVLSFHKDCLGNLSPQPRSWRQIVSLPVSPICEYRSVDRCLDSLHDTHMSGLD